MLASLDELVLSCLDDSSKTHIQEAIRCYQSGNYRAAIVITYIAVCFDLIEKLKGLAATGDAAAKNEIVKLHNLQEQYDRGDHQAVTGILIFERNLLEMFRDRFEFVGQNEFEELSRLRNDRNRCAHPSFSSSSIPYKPSPELARLHIFNAISIVLSQPPRQGKAALENLQAIVLSPYFPKKVEDAIEFFRGTELANARPSLVNAFADLLAFGLGEASGPLFMRLPTLIALEALVDIHRLEALPRLAVNTNKLLRSPAKEASEAGVLIAIRMPEIGEMVEVSGRTIVKSWLKETNSGKANGLSRAYAISWAREEVDLLAQGLSSEDLQKLTFDVIPRSLISRSVALYCESKSWDAANKVARECVIPFANRYTIEDIEEIFSAAKEGKADLRGSHGFREFVEALYKNNSAGKVKLNKLTKKYGLESYRP